MKKILINDNPWQIRVAITDDELLQNVYFSSPSQTRLERVFFKGLITKVLPGIQTAFVDIGQEKAGFLHISEIDRDLAIARMSKHAQLDDDDQPRQARQAADISKIFKEGDSALVQVSKEPVYEKGAKLTTCFTFPGRFIVLMPNIPRIGISKKIEDRDERMRLKDIVKGLLPEGMGAIIRTTCQGRQEKEISKDVGYLLETWNLIDKNYKDAKPKQELYHDIPLPLQIVRDHLDEDVEAVITDNKETLNKIYRFVKKIAPEFAHKVSLYDSHEPLFKHYGIEQQIQSALEKKVNLQSGGSLIIESTEAMTVIDVNTGKFIGKKNLEETILATNLEAAQEIVRQLRLRNIGGLIVIDFIDMSFGANKHKLFRFFEKNLREKDKFQSVVLKISEFGIVQMTRKRSGLTLTQQMMRACSCCHGLGVTSSVQTQAYEFLLELKRTLKNAKLKKGITASLNPELFTFLTNKEYNSLLALEHEFKIKITLKSDEKLHLNQHHLERN